MESYPHEIKVFLATLERRGSSAPPKVEAGGKKSGNWWIDVPGKNGIAIEWRPKLGFGFSMGDAKGYGEGPTEIFRSPMRAAHRVMQLTGSRSGPPPTGLRAVRELYGITQDQIAGRLKKGQAAISRLETRSDSKVETLNEYILALGGRMEIRIVFPDAQLPIYPTGKSRARKTRLSA